MRIRTLAGAVGALVVLAAGGTAAAQDVATTTTSGPTTTTTTTATAAATCELGDQQLRAGLASAAATTYLAATTAGLPCTPGDVARARAVVRSTTDDLREITALRRAAADDAALEVVRSRLRQATEADPSDPRPPALLAEVEAADLELERIDELIRSGFVDEAEERLEAFVVAHPDAVVPAAVVDRFDPSAWDRLTGWAAHVGPGLATILLLGLAIALVARTTAARWRSGRLQVAAISAIGADGASTPSPLGSLLVARLSDLAEDGREVSARFVTGPDEAIDLPTAEQLPDRLKVISALAALLPRPRGHVVEGSLEVLGSTTRLSLRLLQGRPERGRIVDAVVVTSTAADPVRRDDELTGTAAAWLAFAGARIRHPEQEPVLAGTGSWKSYAAFTKGVSTMGDPPTATTHFVNALGQDPRNVGALVNLAHLHVSDRPVLAERYAARAIEVLGDHRGTTPPASPDGHPPTPDPRGSPYLWTVNWYRAMAHLATANLNQVQDEPDHPDRVQILVDAAVVLDRLLAGIAAVDGRARPGAATPDPGRTSFTSASRRQFLDSVRTMAHILRATVHTHQGDPGRADEQLQQVTGPLNSTSSFNLACAYATLHRLGPTLDHLREAALVPRLAAAVQHDRTFAWVRDGHPAAWAALFPDAAGRPDRPGPAALLGAPEEAALPRLADAVL